MSGNNLQDDEATMDSSGIKKVESTECKVAILPYYGLADSQACTVTPRELFILPKNNATVTITIQPPDTNKSTGTRANKEEFFCKILGFLRIAPSDKYRDNCYSRPDGYYFSPIEIDVTAKTVKPRLVFNIPKSDRTFTCCVNDVMQAKRKLLELYKTFFFYNYESNIMSVALETYDPFHIKSVSIYAEANLHKPVGTIYINGHGCAEVEILCIVNENLIQTVLDMNETQDLHESVITLKEPLIIIHTDKHTQDVELILQIWLPLIKLSSYTLDFGLVYVGDTKKLTLVIQNLSIHGHNFKLNTKSKNTQFAIEQSEENLSNCYIPGTSCFTITISFQPGKAEYSTETLEIITDIPDNVEECMLHGGGTLDEKYHIPGV